MKMDGVPSNLLLATDRKRVAAFLAVYVVVRFLADVASTRYAAGTGFSPWFLGTALDIVLFLVLGWKWWPLPVVLMTAHALRLPEGLRANLSTNIGDAIIYEMIFAWAVKLTVDQAKVSFPLRTLRDVSYFAGILFLRRPSLLGSSRAGFSY